MKQLNPWRPTTKVMLGNGDEVTVSEMSWPEAREFLKALSAVSAKVVDAGIVGGKPDFKKVLEVLLTESDELADQLLKYAVKDHHDIATGIRLRGVSDFIVLVSAALEINVSPAVVDAVEGLAKKVTGVVGGMTATTTPTTTEARPR